MPESEKFEVLEKIGTFGWCDGIPSLQPQA